MVPAAKIVLWITFYPQATGDDWTKKYISEIIEGNEFYPGQLNIIASGTGTGKTEFVRRTLLEKIPDFDPSEILYVTSRSMTRDQQAELDGIERLGNDSIEIIKYWNGEIGELKEIHELGIWIMNYNQLAHILDFCDPEEGELLQKIKLAVFDECHTLFSDDFIEGMGIIRQWVRERIRDESVILIGMTATKGILDYNAGRFGSRIKTVNKDFIVNYKAKHLICAVKEDLIDLLANRNLPGKTIILCPSVRECQKLNSIYHNSVVLVSQNNKSFTEEMAVLRRYIIENEVLPESTEIFPSGYTRGIHPIEVLITTTSMREGINLREESGIKNVICCLTDEMHVKQFMGRCRFNVENLIVVYGHYPRDNMKKNDYTANSRKLFSNYIADKNDREWFDSISEIVDCSFEEVERYRLDPDWNGFLSWVDTQWVRSRDAPDDKPISEQEYEQFEDYAYRCRLFGRDPRKYTFNAILRCMCNDHGYSYEQKRSLDDDGRKITYKYLQKDG